MTTDYDAHFAWWSHPETVIRTQAEAEQAIAICVTCQELAALLRVRLYGRQGVFA